MLASSADKARERRLQHEHDLGVGTRQFQVSIVKMTVKEIVWEVHTTKSSCGDFALITPSLVEYPEGLEPAYLRPAINEEDKAAAMTEGLPLVALVVEGLVGLTMLALLVMAAYKLRRREVRTPPADTQSETNTTPKVRLPSNLKLRSRRVALAVCWATCAALYVRSFDCEGQSEVETLLTPIFKWLQDSHQVQQQPAARDGPTPVVQPSRWRGSSGNSTATDKSGARQAQCTKRRHTGAAAASLR